jgi:hypothetical protein
VLGLSDIIYSLLDLGYALVVPNSEVHTVVRREFFIVEGFRYTHAHAHTMNWELQTKGLGVFVFFGCYFVKAVCLVKFIHFGAGQLIQIADPYLYTSVYVCMYMYEYMCM